MKEIIAALGIAFASPTLASAETGKASYYGNESGSKTASGERYNQWAQTCAHRRHKFGTVLKVTNLKNGVSATCRVNDRGPFIAGRIIDVSVKVAHDLQMVKSGVVPARVEVVR